MPNKDGQLTAALSGRSTDHCGFLVRLHLQVIGQLAASVTELTEPLRPVVTLLADRLWDQRPYLGGHHR